jgi:hypothetical protein
VSQQTLLAMRMRTGSPGEVPASRVGGPVTGDGGPVKRIGGPGSPF